MTASERRFAFIGFGNVARTFARILEDRRDQLASDYSLRWRTLGVATSKHGCITAANNIDLLTAVSHVESGHSLADLPDTRSHDDPLQVIEQSGADVVFETVPLNPADGQPAIDYIPLINASVAG